ncbi:MAG: diguanylate cyclase [Sulfuriflexus sp.]|nr:diguanylate cyclase [Sulfuriflexus sp.]
MADPIDTIWMTGLFQASPVGMILFNDDGSVSWANSQMEAMTNLSFSQLIGMDRNMAKGFQLESLFTKPDELIIKYRINHTPRYLSCEYKTLQSPSGGTVEVGFYIDITETCLLRDRVERLVLSDDLTGALNKRGLLRDLDPLISRSRRYENPLSLIQFEFDLSTCEDKDQTMLKICRGIRSELRWADLVSRYNENNFLLVLPETDLDSAKKLASKLLDHLNEFYGSEMPACFGTTAQWQRGNDVKMLLERMESGMAIARENENNQVVAA